VALKALLQAAPFESAYCNAEHHKLGDQHLSECNRFRIDMTTDRKIDIKVCSLGVPVGKVNIYRCAERQERNQRPESDAKRTCPREHDQDCDHDIREACGKEVCDGASDVKGLPRRREVKDTFEELG